MLQPVLRQEQSQQPGAYYRDILLGLLLLATPFLLFPKGYALLALLVLPLLWLIRWSRTGHFIPRTPLDGPVLLILIAILVSLWTTFDLSFSIGKVAGLLLGIVLFYAIIDLSQTKTSLQNVIIAFIIVGLGIALLGLLGTSWSRKFPFVQPVFGLLPEVLRNVRGAEEGFNANEVGGVLIFFIPLQVVLTGYYLGLSRRSTPNQALVGLGRRLLVGALFGLSLLVTAGVLLLSQSRGALGGLAVGLLAIAALRTTWGKVLLGAGLIALAWLLCAGSIDSLMGSGLDTDVAGVIRLDGRLEIWSRGVEALADFPLGLGMNNFRRVMPLLYPGVSVRLINDIGHAHNHLLQVGLDLGLPGLVAYLALWLGAGFLLGQIIAQSQDRFYRLTALGLLGGLVAYFIYGLTDAVALGAKPGFILWWTLGLIVASYKLSTQVKQPDARLV